MHTKVVYSCRRHALDQKYQQKLPFARLYTKNRWKPTLIVLCWPLLHLIRYFLKQYHVSRSNIEFVGPSYMLRFESLCMCFCVDCGRVILGLSVKYPRCQNRKKIIHRGLLQPSSQVLFTVVITSTHSGSMALDLPPAEDPVVALQLFSDSHLGTRCWRAPNRAKHLKHDYK